MSATPFDPWNPDSSAAPDGLDGSPKGGLDIPSRTVEWLSRFIRVTNDGDLVVLAFWILHTHCIDQVYTTPRLLIDSSMPGSGKTTVLEHIQRLAYDPLQAASLSSPALLARIIDSRIRTICIDECDRNLDPKREGVGELLAILNSGYKRGATRPVLVPAKGGTWDVSEMATFAPVAMAGNQPALPDDTRSRTVRILLMPDLDGTVEESDWEAIEDDAAELKALIQEWVEINAERVRGTLGELPPDVKGRARERWKPLKKVADAFGGVWPERIAAQSLADIAETEHEKEDGMRRERPEMVLLRDVKSVWPQTLDFTETSVIVNRLTVTFPMQWGASSTYGRDLTPQRMGRMLSSGFKIYATKNENDKRGYYLATFQTVWQRMGLGEPSKPSEASEPSAAGGAK